MYKRMLKCIDKCLLDSHMYRIRCFLPFGIRLNKYFVYEQACSLQHHGVCVKYELSKKQVIFHTSLKSTSTLESLVETIVYTNI